MTEHAELIPTRQSLLSRLKDWDDQESWREFFDTYGQLIYGVARKAGLSDAEAQEVVQETVIAVARNIGGFRTDPALGSFKSWLLNLTRWRLADQVRKRPRPAGRLPRSPDDTGLTSTVDRIADPAGVALEALWDEEWARNLTDAALARVKQRVDAKQYQIFFLHVIKKQSVAEVARALGVNRGQIYLAKHRVGALLKKEIKKLEESKS